MGWDKSAVVQEVRTLHQAGRDLSFTAQRGTPLWSAAFRYFGSYGRAVKAAGIDYDRLSRRLDNKWDRGRIVAALRKLHRQKQDLSSRSLRRTHAALYAAGIHWFGSHRNAIAAAGIEYHRVSHRSANHWDRKSISRLLRKLRREGKPLHHAAMDRTYPHVVVAAYRYFGTYRNAVEQAGLNYEQVRVRPPRTWSRPRVQRELRKLRQSGQGLWERQVRRNNSYLPRVAKHLFGSYRAAAKSAGIDLSALKSPRYRLWSPERIVQTLQWLEQRAEPLYTTQLLVKRPGLYRACVREYGNYRKALVAAGISYPPPQLRHWTEQIVIRQVRELHTGGRDLRNAAVKKRFGPLFIAARHYFGSWTNAVRVAGLNYERIVTEQLKKQKISSPAL